MAVVVQLIHRLDFIFLSSPQIQKMREIISVFYLKRILSISTEESHS